MPVNHFDPSTPLSHADRRCGMPRRMQGVIEEVSRDAWRVIEINWFRNAGETCNCDLDEFSLVQARTRVAIVPSGSNGNNHLGRSLGNRLLRVIRTCRV